MVRICKEAWFDPAQPGEVGAICKNGNCLTFDEGSSSLAQGNCGHMAQLQIEKYTGPELLNTAHGVPANA